MVRELAMNPRAIHTFRRVSSPRLGTVSFFSVFMLRHMVWRSIQVQRVWC